MVFSVSCCQATGKNQQNVKNVMSHDIWRHITNASTHAHTTYVVDTYACMYVWKSLSTTKYTITTNTNRVF